MVGVWFGEIVVCFVGVEFYFGSLLVCVMSCVVIWLVRIIIRCLCVFCLDVSFEVVMLVVE